jgi:hypothetical protein
MSYKDNNPEVMRNYANSTYFDDVSVLANSGIKGYSLMPSMVSLLNKVTDNELKTQFTKENTKALKWIRGVDGRFHSGLFGCARIAIATTESKFGVGAFETIGDASRRGKSAIVATSLDVLNTYEEELRLNFETLIKRPIIEVVA